MSLIGPDRTLGTRKERLMSLGLRGSTDLPEPRGETAGTSNSLSPGGLSMQRAQQLLTDVEPNRLVSGDARPSLVAWLLRAFADPMVLLLLVAGATYLALGDRFDAVVVLVAVVPIIA